MAAVNSKSGGGSGGSKGIRAGAAYVELYLEDNAFRRSLESNRKRLSAASAMLAKAGVVSFGVGASIATPILAAFKTTFDSINKLSALSNKLDTPIEGLSALANAAEAVGIDVEDLEGHFENLQERIARAAQGQGEGIGALAALGIDARALEQMDRVEQFATVVERLQKVGNRTQALGMASALGGDKFQEVLKIKDVRGGMDEARRNGWVFTEEQKQQAAEISKAWFEVKNSFMSVVVQIGSAILEAAPTIKEYAGYFKAGAKAVSEWIKENKGVVSTALYVAAALTGVGAGLIALAIGAKVAAIAMGGVSVALTVAGSILSLLMFFTTPLGIALGVAAIAVGAMVAGILALGDTDELLKDLGKTFDDLGKDFKSTWTGVKDAIMAGELELAFEIAKAGITKIWYGMLANLQSAFIKFWDSIRKEVGRIGRFGMDMSLIGVGVNALRDNGWATRKASEAEQELQRLNGLAKALKELKQRPEAAKENTYKPGGAQPRLDPVKAIGAFNSRDFSRIFDTGSLAKNQLKQAQMANAKLENIFKRLDEGVKVLDKFIGKFAFG